MTAGRKRTSARNPSPARKQEGASELRKRLWRRLGDRAHPLRTLVRAARRAGVDTFLVGGPVRDLLLGRTPLDLDVLVSARIREVAGATARELGGRAEIRPRFLTATVEASDLRLDLAQARREHYARPGALPQVEPAPVEEELRRRDFSIHALALPLDRRAGAELVDPCGGLADLRARRIRTLHPASFCDDPTRMFRAARYAARLGFRIETATARQLAEGLRAGWLEPVSGERIRAELDRLLDEESAVRAARSTEGRGLFDAIQRGWHPTPRGFRALRALERARSQPPWPAADATARRAAGWRALLLGNGARVRAGALERLGLRGRSASAIDDDVAHCDRLARRLVAPLSDGALDRALSDCDEPLLLLLWSVSPRAAARRVEHYVSRLRAIPTPLDGHAVSRAGFRGPEIGAVLTEARRRALDGHPVDEGWLARRLAALRRMD